MEEGSKKNMEEEEGKSTSQQLPLRRKEDSEQLTAYKIVPLVAT